MKSNGCGSFVQRIIVQTPVQDADQVGQLLGIEPFEIRKGLASFEWTHQSTRRGDDEDIVFDLSRELGFDLKWRIDWDKSDY